MTPRRTFLKGIFATVAIVATGNLVAASEMLGNLREEFGEDPYRDAKWEEWSLLSEESGRISDQVYRDLTGQSWWQDVARYDFRDGEWIRLPSSPSQVS